MAAYEYPSEGELERISTFTGTAREWFARVRGLWWMPEWGWDEADVMDDGRLVRRYRVSTGGWSGNEDLLGAMEANYLWWHTWVSSRRGGHFMFEAADDEVCGWEMPHREGRRVMWGAPDEIEEGEMG